MLDKIPRKTLALIFLSFLLLQGCGSLKYKIRKPPKPSTKGAGRLERRLGDTAASQLYRYYSVHPDQAMQLRIQQIGHKLAAVSERPNIEWRFVVIDADELHAWSAPSGYVWISSGAVGYLEDDDYIASVLAYQAAHVVAKHKYGKIRNRMIVSAIMTGAQIGLATMSTVQASRGKYGSAGLLAGAAVGLQAAHPAVKMMFSKHSKKDKLRADQLAMRYILRAGYDPNEYIKMLDFINAPGPHQAGQSFTFGEETEMRIVQAKQFITELESLEGIRLPTPIEEELVIQMVPVAKAPRAEEALPEEKPKPKPVELKQGPEPKGVWIDAEDYLAAGGRAEGKSYWESFATSGLVGLLNPKKELLEEIPSQKEGS